LTSVYQNAALRQWGQGRSGWAYPEEIIFDSGLAPWQTAAPLPTGEIRSPGRREAKVAKAEWGMKRLCPNCGTRYYDMRRDPIVCPHCGSPFDPEALLKTRRARAAAPVAEPVADEEIEPDLGAEEVAEPAEADAALPDAEAEGEDDEAEEAESEEEEEEVLEDASELGEDEDDMAEVIENVDEDEE
jgi:uncharacterized protein (TIGR02300 family)